MRRNNDTKIMKPLSHYLKLFTVLLSLILSSLAEAVTLDSSVNRNQVNTNETLTLRLIIDEQVDSSALDLSALENDFEVLNVTPHRQSGVNFVNGKSESKASTTWTITLYAKREGKLTIPSFTVNSATSKPISINVGNATQGQNSSQPLEVKVSTNTNEIYPNQQFIVEIELSAASNVRGLSGPQLVIPNADVEAIDQEDFQRVDNGIARQVALLKYSVFAKQAGEIVIPVMTYTGIENGRRGVFGTRGTQVIARSKLLKLSVKNAPSKANQPWFPAEGVSITSRWSSDTSALKVGEPITRTITIAAKGQQASVIPPLDNAIIDAGLKSYKDQPQLNTSKSTQGLIATRVESEAIVANKAGDYVLSALSIDWWDINSNKWQTSTLEQQTLNVTGSAAAVSLQPEQGVTDAQFNNSTSTINAQPNRLWQMLSALLALIVLIQFYLLYRKPEATSDDYINQSEQTAWASLQTSIKSDNYSELRNNLLTWARAALKSDVPISLDLLSKVGGSQDLLTFFDELDQHLYKGAKAPDNSQVGTLFKELRANIKQSQRKQSHSRPKLQSLYPSEPIAKSE